MANGYAKPNFTQLPNALLDHHLPQMKEAELKVVLAIARATFGWHKESDKLSLSQLMKKTGLGRQGVVNGIQAGIERGIINREPDGLSFVYSLVVEDEVVHETYQSTKRTSPPNVPPVVHETYQLEPEVVHETYQQVVHETYPQKKGVKETTTTKEMLKEKTQPNSTPQPSAENPPMDETPTATAELSWVEFSDQPADCSDWSFQLLTDPDVGLMAHTAQIVSERMPPNEILRFVASWYQNRLYAKSGEPIEPNLLAWRLKHPDRHTPGPMSPEFQDSALYRRHYAAAWEVGSDDPPQWVWELPEPPKGTQFENADGMIGELVFIGAGGR